MVHGVLIMLGSEVDEGFVAPEADTDPLLDVRMGVAEVVSIGSM
jgi:hypothetical protein